MALHEATLDKGTVRHVVADAVAELQRDPAHTRISACTALGIGTQEWSDCRDQLIDELKQAEDWMAREDALVQSRVDAPPIDSDDGPDFIPSHPTLALVQSAMEEELDSLSGREFRFGDPQWLSVLYQRLRTRFRGKAPFVAHQVASDFRVPLSDRATVALVSDWGTGNAHAAGVARQIRSRHPDHVIHLGDVYYAGTPREVENNFLDMWRAFGPPAARYWALNANHDMYSGGHGYFGVALPALGQPASYFNLQNRFWRLIGLDSAYVNHTFTVPQMAWLEAQLTGDARNVLLTHHHLLSPFRKRGDSLEEWLHPHLAAGQLFAWFWGHEHHLIEFVEYRGVKCRCIGHGSLPHLPPDLREQRHAAQIVRMETRRSPLDSSRGMHGFALLTFDGPVLHIEYVDEAGGTAWTERWD